MSATYRTCNHLHDTGGLCNSAAVTGQRYCAYHLRFRARQLRMAQYRARAERFYLTLPPLEDMHAVQSAISQVAEAIAADMIDFKRADRLLAALRLASRNLIKADKWPAGPYHTEVEAPAIDLAAEYGLPHDIDVDTPPETAFPPSDDPSLSVILGEDGASLDDLSSRPRTRLTERVRVEGPAVDFSVGGRQLPDVGNCGDFPDADPLDPRYVVSPDTLEIAEIYEKVSPEAATVRMRQLDRNRHRRELNANRKRFEQMAMRLNIRHAAERLAAKKLAERTAQEQAATKKPPASAETSETIAPKEAIIA